MNDAQQTLDYLNDAQAQVAADTLAIIKRTTILTSASGVATLPADLIRLEEVSQDTEPLTRVGLDDLLLVRAGATTYQADRAVYYTVFGGQVHIQPASAQTLSLTYYARPAALLSGSELELDGEYDELCKRLAEALAVYDRGEPEMSAHLLNEYDMDAYRLRHQSVSPPSLQLAPTRMRLPAREGTRR